MELLPVGEVPGIPPPAAPVPGAETLADVGRLRTYVHMLNTRRDMEAASVTETELGEAEIAAIQAAINLAGPPSWLDPTVTAAMAAAIPDALAAALPDALAAALSDALAAVLPNALAEALPDALAEALPDALAEALPDALAEALPDAMAAALPGALPDPVEAALPPALPGPLAAAVPPAQPTAITGADPGPLGPVVAAAVNAAMGPAMTAAVNAAVPPAVATASMSLNNYLRSLANRAAFNGPPHSPLDPLYRPNATENAAPVLPPANQFPATQSMFEQWGAVGHARSANNAAIDTLLEFYGIVDPVTGVTFPATSFLSEGAPGDNEMGRKHDILGKFVKGLSS